MNNTKIIKKAYNFQYKYDLDRKKELAAVYTPETVVQFITNTTIDSYLSNNPTDSKNIKIIDPACGSGIFLLYAIDYLLTVPVNSSERTSSVSSFISPFGGRLISLALPSHKEYLQDLGILKPGKFWELFWIQSSQCYITSHIT